MKLNLGCGRDKKVGYTNIDIRPEIKPNLVYDLSKIPYPYDNESIEEIFAKDFIEHFSYKTIDKILNEWHRILKKGGKLYIQTPDLESLAHTVILSNKYSWEQMSYWVYGAQDYPNNTHKAGFTIPTLRDLLTSKGFQLESIDNDGGSNIICWAIKT